MSLIVTGAKGFVGHHLCLALKKEGIEHKGIDVPEYNLNNGNHIKKLFEVYPNITGIIHLAAVSHTPLAKEYPLLTLETNIMATANLLEKCLKKKGFEKFIYLSSSSVYKPNHIYNVSKLSAELITNVYNLQYKLPACVVRTANVYGAGDSYKRVVHSFVEKAITGKPIIIEGTGEQKRVFTHVSDLVEGLIKVIKSKDVIGKTINITGEKEYSVKELAEIVKEFIPSTQIVYTEGRTAEVDKEKMDITEARKLGYEPQYSLKKGIGELVLWIQSNLAG